MDSFMAILACCSLGKSAIVSLGGADRDSEGECALGEGDRGTGDGGRQVHQDLRQLPGYR
ncbi:hypothetical protein [Rufibacter tibetensis]|uniref:hypothetical protein n=1 Tax=Rufibacter tibetensis TaxID=512763 RepID=UPI0012FB9D48|nr:hypothetical protein [Rufibacter tibetensis]